MAGNLEYTSDAENWRDRMEASLTEMGVTVLSPIKPMFDFQEAETPEFRRELLEARSSGDFSYVKERMKPIIERDLRLIDLCDFCVINLEVCKPTFGTIHELVIAEQQQKPIFLIVRNKRVTPLWILGLLDSKYIYESQDEVISTLRGIDQGVIQHNPKKWKLLSPDKR